MLIDTNENQDAEEVVGHDIVRENVVGPAVSSGQVDILTQKKTNLKGKFSDVPEHRHDDNDLSRVKLVELGGFIETVSAVPTNIPRNFYDQIKLYVNGVTIRLYVYDVVNTTWRSFT